MPPGMREYARVCASSPGMIEGFWKVWEEYTLTYELDPCNMILRHSHSVSQKIGKLTQVICLPCLGGPEHPRAPSSVLLPASSICGSWRFRQRKLQVGS